MQNHVFVSKRPVVILQNPVFNPKGTFATCETLFHFQNTLLHPCKTLFQFSNALLQPATAVLKTIWHYCSIASSVFKNDWEDCNDINHRFLFTAKEISKATI